MSAQETERLSKRRSAARAVAYLLEEAAQNQIPDVTASCTLLTAEIPVQLSLQPQVVVQDEIPDAVAEEEQTPAPEQECIICDGDCGSTRDIFKSYHVKDGCEYCNKCRPPGSIRCLALAKCSSHKHVDGQVRPKCTCANVQKHHV